MRYRHKPAVPAREKKRLLSGSSLESLSQYLRKSEAISVLHI